MTRLAFLIALIVLPNGWIVRDASGITTGTDTMPQGAAASPDGKTLAVVESGFNPPTLRLYATSDLDQIASVPLEGAFGRPVWIDAGHVLVAGANADKLFDVEVASQRVRSIAMPAHSYPTFVAKAGATIAVATDGDSGVRVGTLDTVGAATATYVGGHIGGIAFSPGGKTLYASNWTGRNIVAFDMVKHTRRTIATGLHPGALLTVAGFVYVAESDDGTVSAYDVATGKRVASLAVGTSPNALARQGETIFASAGASNSIVAIRNDRVAGRIAAGWYPTDVVPIGKRLYIIDGKGEGTRPNPNFMPQKPGYYDYIASIQYGSIRTYDLSRGLGA